MAVAGPGWWLVAVGSASASRSTAGCGAAAAEARPPNHLPGLDDMVTDWPGKRWRRTHQRVTGKHAQHDVSHMTYNVNVTTLGGWEEPAGVLLVHHL